MSSILHLLGPNLATGTTKQLCLIAKALSTKALSSHGVESTICSLEANGRRQQIQRSLVPPSLSLTFCRQPGHFDPTFVFRCARAIRAAKPSLVHLWGVHSLRQVALAMRLAGVRKHVVSVRSQEEASRYQHAPNSDWVVNAEWLLSEVPEGCEGYLARNIVPSTLPKQHMNSRGTSLSPIRRELGIPPDTKLILAIGDLVEKKRFRDLIWALDLLRVLHADVHLLIAGEGGEYQSLRNFADNVVSREAVHLLGHRQDVDGLIRQSFCVWQASEDEGSCNSLVQSHLAETPIVASDIPAHRYLLGDGEFGCLIALGEPAELARRTNLLIQDPSPAREQAKLGRAFVEAEFQAAQTLDSFRAVYAKCLRKHRDSPGNRGAAA